MVSTENFTYELSLDFAGNPLLKDKVRDWLIDIGEESFVDGVIEGIDIEFDYDSVADGSDYLKYGGDTAALILYKFAEQPLKDLAENVAQVFGDQVTCHLRSFDSEIWREGWKESFKPIRTGRFLVCPPWDLEETSDQISVVIDPGMAFGTGQHHTTQLCLDSLDWLASLGLPLDNFSMLDVGTGSGILSIAAAKIGIEDCCATDIDSDAILSAGQNFERNQVAIDCFQGTTWRQKDKKFDLVVANILGVVLRRIFADLVGSLKPNGELMISGILAEEVAEFTEIGHAFNLQVVNRKDLEGWSMLYFRSEV